MRFWKGHALGNDYIVVDASEPPPPAVLRALCDRHRGVGGDGVLVGDTRVDPVALRIFNPDGGEAEKSGNGLRIFGAWLHGTGRVGERPFQVALTGETVEMRVEAVAAHGVRTLRVQMGTASFRAGHVHYTGAPADQDVVGATLAVDGQEVALHLVSVGNPHCVVFVDELDPATFRRVAPGLQALPVFDRGINVQFARVAGPATLEALVWERGAGETLASGSSACAVAAAAIRSGRVAERRLQVVMPGGELEVDVDPAWGIRLRGTAQLVFEGEVDHAVVDGWGEQAGVRS
jgi:diaminopimelate epimerase